MASEKRRQRLEQAASDIRRELDQRGKGHIKVYVTNHGLFVALPADQQERLSVYTINSIHAEGNESDAPNA